MIRLFVLALILSSVTSAAAQGIQPGNPLGTYDLEWAGIVSYISPEFSAGGGTVEVTALTPADPLVDPTWLFSVSGMRCWAWTSGRFECNILAGRIRWWDGFLVDGTLDTRWFDLELFNNAGHTRYHVIATGTKRVRGSVP